MHHKFITYNKPTRCCNSSHWCLSWVGME